MPVVVAHRIRGREQAEPARVEERIEPRDVLAGGRDRTGDRERHRHAFADRLVEEREDAPEIRAAEGREALLDQAIEVLDLLHRTMDETASATASSAARAGGTLILSRGRHAGECSSTGLPAPRVLGAPRRSWKNARARILSTSPPSRPR
jgi:hypothetical protein